MTDKARHPFIQAALLCDRLLQEADGTISAIRIIDTLTLQARPAYVPQEAKPTIDINILLALKSGDITGKHGVALQFHSPSGKIGPRHQLELDFAGGINGSIAYVATTMLVEEMGEYWCDVLWSDDSTLLTRIPLRVRPPETPAAVPAASETQSDKPSAPHQK